MVTLIPNAGVKACVDAYRSTWLALGHKETEMPLVGVFRHVVVADSDEKHAPRPATRIGRGGTIWRSCGIGAAYPFRLVRSIRTTSRRSKRPIWVSPARRKPCGVTSPLGRQTGITYFACDMAFGSLPYDIAARSVDLFVKDVMPAFR